MKWVGFWRGAKSAKKSEHTVKTIFWLFFWSYLSSVHTTRDPVNVTSKKNFCYCCDIENVFRKMNECKFLDFLARDTPPGKSQSVLRCLAQPSRRSWIAWTMANVTTGVLAMVWSLLGIDIAREMPFEAISWGPFANTQGDSALERRLCNELLQSWEASPVSLWKGHWPHQRVPSVLNVARRSWMTSACSGWSGDHVLGWESLDESVRNRKNDC